VKGCLLVELEHHGHCLHPVQVRFKSQARVQRCLQQMLKVIAYLPYAGLFPDSNFMHHNVAAPLLNESQDPFSVFSTVSRQVLQPNSEHCD
jgi:hypothetical protein